MQSGLLAKFYEAGLEPCYLDPLRVERALGRDLADTDGKCVVPQPLEFAVDGLSLGISPDTRDEGLVSLLLLHEKGKKGLDVLLLGHDMRGEFFGDLRADLGSTLQGFDELLSAFPPDDDRFVVVDTGHQTETVVA